MSLMDWPCVNVVALEVVECEDGVGDDHYSDEIVEEGFVGGEVGDEVVHEGGCHCGAVRWKVRASPLPTGGVGWELVWQGEMLGICLVFRCNSIS